MTLRKTTNCPITWWNLRHIDENIVTMTDRHLDGIAFLEISLPGHALTPKIAANTRRNAAAGSVGRLSTRQPTC